MVGQVALPVDGVDDNLNHGARPQQRQDHIRARGQAPARKHQAKVSRMPVNIHLGGNIHQAQHTQRAIDRDPFEAVGSCLAAQRKCVIRNRPCIGQIAKK